MSDLETVKTVLCYGDSNTFGSNPSADPLRHPRSVRWTGRLQALLGAEYDVIEEGLGGRTGVWPDPLQPGRNGLEYLPVSLQSHKPLDLVILSLGTNDCKSYFHAAPATIARGMRLLIETIQRTDYGPGISAPKILLVSPIRMGDVEHSRFESFDRESARRVEQLAPLYQTVAGEYGCAFFDAASVAGPGEDQLHMGADGHRALAEALAPLVKQLV